jgi:hypothetical protein
MSCSPLERPVKHDFRLDLLCCFAEGVREHRKAEAG